ncbi:Crp/Fnr family transcriptional regulator [Hyunsoonleella pacifica]|uniref:Crp/Fnr family transcriptional regulator n=1 Tax=Hyunsoonleella pacifica TaxID=1080224 RepID=A0A4Q9FTG6_9FLAO|nr:Crp/Fnr family transcriptional regulator [Hyunsoonleella pacifica]TBN19076.1 Crp/Fnr family transcriptional regulator [Hyunsoonleella pacifica]GGD07144.1 cAMP-binding protein [Hyunsoonleella pacifica]
MKQLKKHIEQTLLLTPAEWKSIEECCEYIALKKNEIFIPLNTVFNKEVFVENGIARAFLIDQDGNEKSVAFFKENEFITTNALRTKNGRSNYTFQVLTQASLILLDSKKFQCLLNENNKLTQLVKAVKEKENNRLAKRDECLLQVRALDKYKKFQSCYPNIDAKIANHYIASYLGITAVSLSRIRKKLK